MRLFCGLFVSVFLALDCYVPVTYADTFGSGTDTFEIEFVTIGSPGNPPDTLGVREFEGSVSYTFRMSRYEISEEMVDKANTEGGLNISHDGRGPNKPATSITWYEAAMFVNWLNTSNGYAAAYHFNGSGRWGYPGDVGYDPENPYRHIRSHYFLPSLDEWYKAAYYDPVAGLYHDLPTGNDFADGIDFPGDTEFDAVFRGRALNPEPNDITDVGLPSPFGTAGQGGNAEEWIEGNNSPFGTHFRPARGGSWLLFGDDMSRSMNRSFSPGHEEISLGFRIAARIPEPNAATLIALTGLFVISRRRKGMG